MIAACLPTTRRPFLPSPSPSIWSCSPCGVTRSAPWSYGGRESVPGALGPARWLRAGGRGPRRRGARELVEETGLCAYDPAAPPPVPSNGAHLEQLATYGAPDRDPRMRVVSVAHLALARTCPPPGRAATLTVPAGPRRGTARGGRGRRRRRRGASTLAFDHSRILADGVERARSRSSTPLWPRPSARRSSRSESCGASTRPSGAWPGPAQLPPQGDRHARLPGSGRWHHDPSGWAPRPALQGRWGHPPQPAHAASRGLRGGDIRRHGAPILHGKSEM